MSVYVVVVDGYAFVVDEFGFDTLDAGVHAKETFAWLLLPVNVRVSSSQILFTLETIDAVRSFFGLTIT